MFKEEHWSHESGITEDCLLMEIYEMKTAKFQNTEQSEVM